MTSELELTLYSKELLKQITDFKTDWYKRYKRVSKIETPAYDGAGKKIVNKRPDGYDYIEESYMRECLDKHFPGWSWEAAAPLHFLGAEWVVAQGHLLIIDEHLLAFGVKPPIRKFYGVDSVRIQFKKGATHSPENIIDVGDNCKQANIAALKYAINRLTHIGDDIYGKRIEEIGAGSLEDIVLMSNANSNVQGKAFNELVKAKHLTYSKVFEILGIKALSEITDYGDAYKRLKEVIG